MDAASEGSREFRYPVTKLVDGVISIDARVFRFKQGLRLVQVPLANVRAFGVRVRPRVFGVTASELILATEPAAGVRRAVKMPIDLDAAGGKAAVECLKAMCQGAEDVTGMAWEDAAPRLGVAARAWYDFMMTPRGTLGVLLVAGAAGAQAATTLMFPTHDVHVLRGRAIGALIMFAIGVGLMISARRGSGNRK